jgi:catechol 2,3-dioxygenase-like lactoylglutathione lyase family enzyme
VRLTRQATVLLVDEVARATECYRDALRFEVDRFEANPDHYGYARRDGCEIHFRGAGPEAEQRDGAAGHVRRLLRLHKELVRRGAEVLHGPVDQEYGQRELRVRDPEGYILAFGQSRD